MQLPQVRRIAQRRRRGRGRRYCIPACARFHEGGWPLGTLRKLGGQLKREEELKVIIAGASGYIGRQTTAAALHRGFQVFILTRDASRAVAPGVAAYPYDAPPPAAFHQADALFNLAGRAHTTDTGAGHDAFDEANHQLPRRLADQARQAGVRRFVHVSSIGVYGNTRDEPLNEAAPLAPDTPYARSKARGDEALQQQYEDAPTQLAIVRPPMVYGPACPGNFARLRKLLQTGAPLPFGALDAPRSFIYVANLADLLLHVAAHPAGHGLFLAGDGSDYTVPQLLRAMAQESGRPARLFPLPAAWLRAAARLAGLRREMDSLTRPLLVDWSHAHAALDWTPPVDPETALRASLA